MRPGEYYRIERGILDELARLVWRIVWRSGAPVSDQQIDDVVDQLFPVLLWFRRRLYLHAVEELHQQSLMLGVDIPVPQERRYSRDAVRQMVKLVVDPDSPVGGRVVLDELDPETRAVTKSSVVVDEDNRRSRVVVEQVARRVVRGAEHHAHSAGRDALQDAAESTWLDSEGGAAQGRRLGYARVLTGAESCAFCAMLASRGPVYDSAEAAGAIKTFHYGCDCVVRLVLEDEPWEGMDEWQELADLWDSDSTDDEGRSPGAAEARRAFRRNWERRMRENEGRVSDRFVAPSFRGG